MIDFSTLQGLTIPEGVVTQITDASGRVLWSAFDGKVYLRPSADISVDSTITLTPADATAAYLLINEEVVDNAVTSIGVTATDDATDIEGTARFLLSGYVPKNISRITNFHLYGYADASESIETPNADEPYSATSHISTYLYLNKDKKFECSASNTNPWLGDFEGAGYAEKEYTGFIGETTILEALNEYVSTNGTIPSIELEMRLWGKKSTEGSKPVYGYAKVSKVSVVIECE